jgi:thiamine biosynthesis lipoprotein
LATLPGRVSLAALGTTAELLTWPGEAIDDALAILRRELSAIDAACSRFRADSELTRFNRAAGQWVEVTPLFLEALDTALVAALQTGGAVDPTVGPALCLLGYDVDFSSVPPDGPGLAISYQAVPGWSRVEVDRSAARARAPKGTGLDFGATAKALAADRAARLISSATGAGTLVSLGGDLSIQGAPPPGGWPVHVTDDHRATVAAPGQTVALTGGGLATSSTTTRSWERGGQKIHHIVDPATGQPATGPWRTVSVAAATCVDANTASTAALVMGARAVPWLAGTGLPARLVTHAGETLALNGWPEGGV